MLLIMAHKCMIITKTIDIIINNNEIGISDFKTKCVRLTMCLDRWLLHHRWCTEADFKGQMASSCTQIVASKNIVKLAFNLGEVFALLLQKIIFLFEIPTVYLSISIKLAPTL